MATMEAKTPNVRIVNDMGEVASTFYADPEDVSRVAYVKKEFSEIVGLEPDAGWRLETRGTIAGWHRWQI